MKRAILTSEKILELFKLFDCPRSKNLHDFLLSRYGEGSMYATFNAKECCENVERLTGLSRDSKQWKCQMLCMDMQVPAYRAAYWIIQWYKDDDFTISKEGYKSVNMRLTSMKSSSSRYLSAAVRSFEGVYMPPKKNEGKQSG